MSPAAVATNVLASKENDDCNSFVDWKVNDDSLHTNFAVYTSPVGYAFK